MAKIPEFYRQWLEPIIGDIPDEPEATCDKCVMVNPPKGRLTRDPGPFAPNMKCCTYDPYLPNFTVGALLMNGSLTKEALLERGESMTPFGLVPRWEAEVFGQDSACDFLDQKSGGCKIWAHRPTVCWTYTCVSKQGKAGFETWERLESLGNDLEWNLAHEVLLEMGFTDDEINSGDLSEYRGREYDFYVECYKRAQNIRLA